MPRAVDLLREGRHEELWDMCCGFLSLDMPKFMSIQRRLLQEQLARLNRSHLGLKVTRGARPRTLEEFRREVPLTTYADYCPELLERNVAALPAPPATWVHTSGRSGEYPCKWVPLTQAFVDELSRVCYGIGTLSCASDWGDTSALNPNPKLVYTVAPRPYMSGALADLLGSQTPTTYLPNLEEAEGMAFDARVRLGFELALTQGIDYFFGLSMVLVAVGNKFGESTDWKKMLPVLRHPAAARRLLCGLARSKIARRRLLPRDVFNVRGIMCGGLDSWVYRERIKDLWGRYPLDVFASTEGAIIATQTWDYAGMTFIPNLNFLEFIPESEHLKGQLGLGYQPRTLLLDEVRAGEKYELVLTSFHGGALVRYRTGDMVQITALRNDALGIEIPQMVFDRRVDGTLDFVVVRLTEKSIWQGLESSGFAYADWTAYKEPGEPVLNLLIEPTDSAPVDMPSLEHQLTELILKASDDQYTNSSAHDDLADMIQFRVKVTMLERGAFTSFMAARQTEGADLAHLKPPHINPSDKVLAQLHAPQRVGVPAETTPKRDQPVPA
jgi:GH3 auxin-responsive promoter